LSGGTNTAVASYVHGASAEPLIGETIGMHFDRACARHADEMAVIVRHQGIRWTYREFQQRVDAVASGLLGLGLRPSERVGIWAPNCAEWVLTQFATAKAGLVLVTINPAYKPRELEYALNKASCRALVTAVRHKSSDYLDMIGDLAPELVGAEPGQLQSERLPALHWVIVLGDKAPQGCIAFDDLHEHCEGREKLRAVAAGLDFDDAINIQFTSGTTGSPKGATLSHHNLLNNAFFVVRALQLSAGDRLCIPVPLYHCFGMVMGSLGCITHGATMVFPDAGFDPRSTLAAVHEERCVALYGVPTMFIAMLDHPDCEAFDLECLRTGIMAGSPCPIEVMKRVADRMHMHEVTIAYGMTETSPISFQSTVDDSQERRVSTVGRIHPHVEAKIIDASGHTVARGEQGELCTRGYSVMIGYWDDPERTADAIDSAGWMHTGDLATLDDEGFCRIVGRIKDLVIRGGENISPREIEEYIYTHQAVQDVQVVGVPEARLGEELCAWIIRKPGQDLGEAEIRSHFARGEIAHFKIPKHIRFVESFPVTVTGKVLKYAIREAMIAELELIEQETA
jgi:fatty-acyl-CoA synthase